MGPDSVNTMPEATLNSFRDHGVVRPLSVLEGIDESETVLSLLPQHDIDLDAITEKLVEDGLRAFQTDLEDLLEVIDGKLEEIRLA